MRNNHLGVVSRGLQEHGPDIPPSSFTGNTSHAKYTKCKKTSCDTTDIGRYPEQGQTKW